ncbi:MAG: tetratricopeptide repeat protein [Cytophagales bacterium]|nr:tetratricopeptide repeat protein [Cytophagales bacterium]
MLKVHLLNVFAFCSIAAILTLGACASHKKNFFSKTYHNTTARYNSYFIAKENIREVEEAISSAHKNNYGKILGVFHDIDSATIDGVRAQLEDAIVKASLSIQRHENSNWVYPSYYLVGKARYYGGDFVNAIETFKYINKYSEEKDLRHQALVALMRSFIDYGEHSNAVEVADYLRKENLNRENMRDFLLTKAYFSHIREDYNGLVRNLSQAVKMETGKKRKARYYFILGQVYQQLGFEGEAYNNYRKCLKSNPEYELSFYAKLNLAQVTRLDQKVDLKKIRGYFTKLLKDDKNREFIDRIYYEMANFEIKHNDPDLAVEYLKSSIASSVNNPRQKGNAYLRLGELYYDLYKNYELAQAYYDSTVSVLPKDEERFEEIKERAEILTDFVDQLKTIELQDSLLALSEMNKSELQQLLNDYVEEQERIKRQMERDARKLARQTTSADGAVAGRALANPFGIDEHSTVEGATWYFNNLSAISSGRTQFLSRWGNRPLEDNWRRSQRQSTLAVSQDERLETQDTASVEEGSNRQIQESEDKVQALMATIPFTDEAKAEALNKIEDAYFKLGGIYNFQLEEDENAIETYEKLLERFPGSAYEPETLYLLYLIYKPTDEEKSESYKRALTATYPKSIYAKLAINPNYREESSETAQRLQRLYKIAYDYYVREDFNQARLLVSRGLQQYPDNEFSDQLRILGILIDGKVEGQYKYQYELQQFIENYPDSKYLDYANKLLSASREFKSKELQRKGAQYITYFDQPHFFIFVYPDLEGFSELIPALIEKFIDEKFGGQNLKTGNLSLNKAFSIVLVNKFETKESAMDFYKDFNNSDLTLPQNQGAEYENFVITEDNFQILYQTKKTENYRTFFEENYKN